MWLLVPAMAAAGLRADLDTATRTSPDMAVVCSSARTAWAELARLTQAFGDDGALAGEVRAIFAEHQAANLFEEEARLSLAFWKHADAAEVTFDSSRSARQVAETLADLDLGGRTTLREEFGAWIVRDGDGSESRVTVVDGRAHIRDGTPPSDATRLLPKRLVDAMPETPGCVATIHLPEGELGAIDVAVHLSFGDDQAATFAVAGASVEALRGVLFEPGTPPEVRTPFSPEGVLVLGVGIDGIDFSRFLRGADLRKARRLQSALPVTAGTTVALFGTEPVPRMGAVLPLPELSARAIARRAVRVARRQDLPVEKGDRTHFAVNLGEAVVFAAAQDGRLLVATDPYTLDAMEGTRGAPWVEGDTAEMAARYPLVFSSRLLPVPGDGPPRRLDEPFTFAVDLQPGLISGQVRLPLTLDELAGFAEGLRPPEEPAMPSVLPPDSVFPSPERE